MSSLDNKESLYENNKNLVVYTIKFKNEGK